MVLTQHQLELLLRAAGGVPLWGGSVALERLRGDVELLFKLELLELDDLFPYRLSARGVQALEALSAHNGVHVNRLE